MGNTCRGKVKTKEDEVIPVETLKTRSVLYRDSLFDSESSPVVQWEKRQKQLNEEVMEKMREEFNHRPDNFILNLLIASVQFYANYSREKVEIKKHIRDRERAFDRKLEASKRKVLFMGGHEEISGSHVLYQQRGEPYMEMPTPLQFYIVQDNVDLYPEFEYEELQKRQYTDLDGPGYRFCTEYSKRHPGYVRLRCVDIIPGVTRSNTYEDIYGYLRPLDEDEPDPMMDPRPLRRTSLTNGMVNGRLPNGDLSHSRPSLYSDFEESDDEEALARSPTLNRAHAPAPANLKARRHSGVMPNGYPSGGQLGQIITAMRALAKKSGGDNDALSDEDMDDEERPRQNSLSERRPSGLFPRVGPEMRQLRLKSPHTDTTDSRAMMARRLTCVEEEEEEGEENSEEEEGNMGQESNPSGQFGLIPGETLEEVKDEGEGEGEGNKTESGVKQHKSVILHAQLNQGCFINRNIKIRDPGDAYGIATTTERRTYFSSERHMECFEDEFEDLLKVLNKEHLQDTSQRQGVAVTANELMIEEIGPKYYTEFIPTFILKEWPNCAFEWKMRERKGKLDPESKTMYKWPKDINIQEAADMGCNIVPMGHYNPKEPNRVMKIEWQIQFVKAEQILLHSLGHTQMRLLLWMEYLLWDHLGDVPGIKNQHLRYILFWMCEKNFRDWNEARLGMKLKAYIKTLYNSLSSESLPHYFVMSCNMMENIPEKYIRQTQAAVKKMKENLPIYVMHTISRMRMASDFYPRLNVKKLFKLVTMESFGVEMLNPQLLTLTGGNDKEEDDDDQYRSESEEEEGDLEEKRRLHEMRLERQRRAAAANKKTSKDVTDTMPKRPSTIRLDAKIKRVKDLRAGPVLKLFGRHFLAMARASNKNRAYPQAYTYLLLASNMATLLDETANNDDARKLSEQVEALKDASRGGVRDMLGTSWSVNEQHDLVPKAAPSRGPNWEFSRPESQPEPERNSMFGMKQRQTITSLQDLNQYVPDAGPETPMTPDSDVAINELPLDTPTSPLIPRVTTSFSRPTPTEPAPLTVEPLSDVEEPAKSSNTDTVDFQVHNEEPAPTSQRKSGDTPVPSLQEPASVLQKDDTESQTSKNEEAAPTWQADSDNTATPEQEEAPKSQKDSSCSPSPQPSSPASPTTAAPTENVPDTPTSPSSYDTPNFINLREDDSDEEDESTDF